MAEALIASMAVFYSKTPSVQAWHFLDPLVFGDIQSVVLLAHLLFLAHGTRMVTEDYYNNPRVHNLYA